MADKKQRSENKLDEIVAKARREKDEREQSYREKALKLYPWICGRCSREFTRQNLSELTVHHRDHNHDKNPDDGSNWELLCLYCHDNEHSRYIDKVRGAGYEITNKSEQSGGFKPFADLKKLLDK